MAFEDAVVNDNMSGEAAFLYTYGLYLSHGGTFDSFMDMDMDDVQLMYTAYETSRHKSVKEILNGIASMFGATE